MNELQFIFFITHLLAITKRLRLCVVFFHYLWML